VVSSVLGPLFFLDLLPATTWCSDFVSRLCVGQPCQKQPSTNTAIFASRRQTAAFSTEASIGFTWRSKLHNTIAPKPSKDLDLRLRALPRLPFHCARDSTHPAQVGSGSARNGLHLPRLFGASRPDRGARAPARTRECWAKQRRGTAVADFADHFDGKTVARGTETGFREALETRAALADGQRPGLPDGMREATPGDVVCTE